jgi:hypothetical protein
VLGLKEIVPAMNDIFIQEVNKSISSHEKQVA